MIDTLYLREAERLSADPIIKAMVDELMDVEHSRLDGVVMDVSFPRRAHLEYVKRGGKENQLSSIGGPARAIRKLLGFEWKNY
jgi:hypothetical protein